MAPDNIRAQLIRDEGWVNRAYKDTADILTIGVGHNLGKPISEAAINQILTDDIDDARSQIVQTLPWAIQLDAARYGALVNLVFNMGIGAVLKFEHFLGALEAKDYSAASSHLLDSRYAHQVPVRAHRLAKQIETGQWQ